MTKIEAINKIKTLLGITATPEIKLERVTSGELTFEFDGELAEGKEIFIIKTVDNEEIKEVPENGFYVIGDKKIEVQDGKILSIEEVVEAEAEAEVPEQPMEEETVMDDIFALLNATAEKLSDLEARLAIVETSYSDLLKDVEKLKGSASDAPIQMSADEKPAIRGNLYDAMKRLK